MNEDNYRRMEDTENKVLKYLREVIKTKGLQSETGKNVYESHKSWLTFTWNSYSADAHIGLAKMYVEDERFTKYYDTKVGVGAAKVLQDIIIKYAK